MESRPRLFGKIFNGKEVIDLKEIIVSGPKIKIPLQIYEASLDLIQKAPNLLEGFHIKHNKNPEVRTPIIGKHGIKERFISDKKSAEVDLNGRWQLSLTDEKNQVTPGIGVFEQKGDYFTGSVLTPTGDYRYLEGFVSGNNFEAASFDGIFNYLFKERSPRKEKFKRLF